jgi:hypothetical protein
MRTHGDADTFNQQRSKSRLDVFRESDDIVGLLSNNRTRRSSGPNELILLKPVDFFAYPTIRKTRCMTSSDKSLFSA